MYGKSKTRVCNPSFNEILSEENETEDRKKCTSNKKLEEALQK